MPFWKVDHSSLSATRGLKLGRFSQIEIRLSREQSLKMAETVGSLQHKTPKTGKIAWKISVPYQQISADCSWFSSSN
jgi:hypothetical protein